MHDIDYVIRAANSPEFHLWKHYEFIGENYRDYINSAKRLSKKEYVANIANSAKLMQVQIGHILGESYIPNLLVRNISHLVKWTLVNQYLNFTQLFLGFIHSSSQEDKIKHLTALYYLLPDLVEAANEADTEPEKLLEPTGE